MKQHFDVCPICNGTGEYEQPHKMSIDMAEVKGRIARELHGKGYSIRQIMKALGYKSPRSIQLFIQNQTRPEGQQAT